MRKIVFGLGMVLALAACAGAEWEVEDGVEEYIDPYGAALTVKWDPGGLRWERGVAWRPVLTPEYYFKDSGYPRSVTVRAEPREDAEVVAEIIEDVKVEIVGGLSVWTHLDLLFIPEYDYVVWLKVKAGELVGWVDQLPIYQEFVGGERACWGEVVDLARVTFRKPYEPLYTGPGTSFPVVREEWGRGAEAGRHYRLLARCDDWYCLGRDWGGAWFPGDTPGVTVEYLIFVWEPREDMIFCFYLPDAEEVDSLFYAFRSYYGCAHVAEEAPQLTLTTTEDKFALEPTKIRDYGFHETCQGDYEVVLPQPVKREAITSITFAVGTDSDRREVTVDPRPAWAEYDEGR